MQYVGIKYSALAYRLPSRHRHRDRQRLLLKAGTDTEAGKSNGGWIEAVLENGLQPGMPAGGLRIYFAGGAYCQISSAGEAALVCGVAWAPGCKGMISFSGSLKRSILSIHLSLVTTRYGKTIQ